MNIPFLGLGAMHEEIADELSVIWKQTVNDSAFIGGAAVDRFEASFAAYCGTELCVGVADGTDALLLAMRAAGIGPGDEVIIPTNTFFATAEAVSMAGATPVFVDVDEEHLLLDPAAAEAAITPCLLYTSPSPRDLSTSRMPSSA